MNVAVNYQISNMLNVKSFSCLTRIYNVSLQVFFLSSSIFFFFVFFFLSFTFFACQHFRMVNVLCHTHRRSLCLSYSCARDIISSAVMQLFVSFIQPKRKGKPPEFMYLSCYTLCIARMSCWNKKHSRTLNAHRFLVGVKICMSWHLMWVTKIRTWQK